MAYSQPTGPGAGAFTAGAFANERGKAPTFQKTKSIAYGTSDQIYSASSTTAVDAPSGTIPQRIELTNNGSVPLNILVGYETYSTELLDSTATRYLHVMLMPGEVYYPSVRAVISTEDASTQFDGTALSNQVPASVKYTASGALLAEEQNPASETDIEVDNGSGATAINLFRVNDLIRIDDEIMRVDSISGEVLTVTKGLFGTDSVVHSNNDPVRFAFFNAYHDFDRYSVPQTDSNGKFKCTNFFGVGRAISGVQGIVPGSVAIKFYTAGYQELGLSGITSSTNSGLAVSTTYGFDITVDGSGNMNSGEMQFTTDSSNVNFGGTNGIISKIQAVLDARYYVADSDIFQEKVTIGIVNGDIRFTSGQRLATSAILLAAPTAGQTTPFGVGRFPAIGSIDAAVAAKLPDDVVYDRITYAQSPNSGVFGYDDGFGRLLGMCNGIINYETGAIDMTGCPANAEFVYTVAHSSGFSGKLDTGANAIVEILANTPSQKWNGSVEIKTY